MKKKILWSVLICLFCLFFSNSVFAEKKEKLPEAFMPETKYEFEPVPEGTLIEKKFVIINKGTAPLIIYNIITGCGCTTAEYAKLISPNAVSNIGIKVSTDYEGGNDVTHNIRILTNDKKSPELSVKIFGKVKRVYKITPARIRLVGPSEQEISQIIKITPEKDYPFKVKSVKAKSGENIMVFIDENAKKEITLAMPDKNNEDIDWEEEIAPPSFYFVVRNKAKKVGRYYDKIFVETDSKLVPTIELRVWGNIFERTQDQYEANEASMTTITDTKRDDY